MLLATRPVAAQNMSLAQIACAVDARAVCNLGQQQALGDKPSSTVLTMA